VKTLVIVLDAVNLDDLDVMPNLDELRNKEGTHVGPLDAGFPGYSNYGGRGHTVSSSACLLVGQDPTIGGQLCNRFRWDEPSIPATKISTHQELDQDNYMYDIIDQEGYKSLWLNLPVLYPPERLDNGVTISGVLAPPGGRFAEPKEVEDKLKSGGYAGDLAAHTGDKGREGWSYIDTGDLQSGEYITDLDKSTLTDEEIKDFAYSMAINRATHFEELNDEYGFDVAVVWISAPDRLRHHLHSFDDPAELETRLLNTVDTYVGEMIDRADPEHLIVHSDHGFGDPAWEYNHHTRWGFFLVDSPLTWIGDESDVHIRDIPYNILQTLNISPPDSYSGSPFLQSEQDEEEVKGRLENMGYLDDEDDDDAE